MTNTDYIMHLSELYRDVANQHVSDSAALSLLYALKHDYDTEADRLDVQYCHEMGVLWAR